MGELDDVLAEVGLHRRHAGGLQRLVEMDLLGGHRLRLHGHAGAGAPGDVEDDPCAPRPRWSAKCTWPPRRSTLSISSLEIVIEALERRLLDGARAVAQRLALGKLAERLAPQPDELRGGDVERLRAGTDPRAPAAPDRAAASRAAARSPHASPLPVEQLGQVDGAHGRAAAPEPALHLHETAGVAGDHAAARPSLRRWRASCRGSPSRPRAGARRTSRRSRSTRRCPAAPPPPRPAGCGAARAATPTRAVRAAGGRNRGSVTRAAYRALELRAAEHADEELRELVRALGEPARLGARRPGCPRGGRGTRA